MTWFKVDDRLHAHPKALATSLAALGLWTVAGSWSSDHLTDGVVPDHVIPLLARGANELADELVAAGLWRRTRGGYRFVEEGPFRGLPTVAVCDWEREDYRKKIPQEVRQVVYERDEFRCVQCGSTDDLTLDHIRPWSKGGPDTVSNLRVLCRSCNSRKGAKEDSWTG